MENRRDIRWLDPRELIEDEENVRRERDDVELAGLAATIREYGVLQPLGVRRVDGRFALVYGGRRRRAAIQAGLASVPCVEVEDRVGDRLTYQLLENLQRRDLNDMDKAEGFAGLRQSLQSTHPKLRDSSLDDLTAQTIGLSIRTVQRYLGLRDLTEPVRDLVRRGDLNVTQAQHLRAIDEPEKQVELARIAVERGASAAIVSRACNALSRQPALSAEMAFLSALRGEEVAPVAVQRPKEPARLAQKPKAEAVESDADLWPEDKAAPEDDKVPSHTLVTEDGNRVFRIRSVDSFCDEVARLARALQEGDLARAMKSDPQASTKLRLARRQLDFVTRELGKLASE